MEKTSSGLAGFIKRTDRRAESKGPLAKTLWQILKFLLVSGLVALLQIVLVNVLFFAMRGWKAPLPAFLSGIFSERSVGAGNSNWGYVLPFFLSNLIANIYGYFQNRKTTFRSDAPAANVAIYILVMICLILFSTWLQGVVANAVMKSGSAFWSALAPTIAMACAGTLQAVILFPLEKFVLLKESGNSGM
ncbi:MAG: hypothetical protein II000_10895 [Clostridia bacterium]|nr:hypothetical protein [Clostridia bacterium]MBQ5757758.1 hypothetical protein [Clostridia bacterium]